MYLAVKFWDKIPNRPETMPSSWPAEVIVLGSSRSLPDNSYRLMTIQDLVEYKQKRQHLYNAYLASLPQIEEPPQE